MSDNYEEELEVEGGYVPVSYRFERGMDGGGDYSRSDSLSFERDANIHFVYQDMQELLNRPEDVKHMLELFMHAQKERIEILEKYSEGKNHTINIGQRRLEKNKSDYRISHNFGGYMSNFVTGYVIGNPVTIEYEGSEDDQGTNDLNEIEEINRLNEAEELNYNLSFDTSRYGRGYELHYRSEESDGKFKDNFVLIDSKEMFIVRDITTKKEIIGAIHCPVFNDMIYLTIYTNAHKHTFKPFKLGEFSLVPDVEPKGHEYGMVPIVEWQNNRFRLGDFEPVIPQMDAYDAAQSDTANYMSDLNDALLVIEGDINSSGLGVNDYAQMKDANLLMLESGTGPDGKQTSLSAHYIYKQYDVAGTEAYKDRLINNMFKLANIPNLDDDKFYSGNSGIALEYKLIGLIQIRSIKERFIVKALRRRYKLIENVHRNLSDVPIDSEKLTFVFHPNIPRDIWSEVKEYIEAGGQISQETLRGLTSFTSHSQEVERLANEELPNNVTDEELAFLTRGRELNEFSED